MAVFRLAFVISALICDVAGWAYMMEGDCPDSYHPGDVWYEGCSRCDCHPGAYACYGCGVVSIPTKNNCYLEKPHPKRTYPQCCQTEELCPGDKNYDTRKLTEYLGKAVGR